MVLDCFTSRAWNGGTCLPFNVVFLIGRAGAGFRLIISILKEIFFMWIGVVFSRRNPLLRGMHVVVPCGDLMGAGLSPGGRRARRGLIPLREAADWRTLGFLGLLGVLFFVQWTGIWRHWGLLVLTCVLSFVACIVKHNHIHCRTFASGVWNRAFEYALGFCTGQSTVAIIPVHSERHHAQNHSEEDFVRSTLVDCRRNWLNLAIFPLRVVWLGTQE